MIIGNRCVPRGIVWLALVWWIAAGGAGHACEGTSVRDAAFNEPRNMHHLYVIGESGDPATDQIYNRMEARLTQYDPETFNVLPRRIDTREPVIQWEEYGFPSPPPAVPVVALVGTNYTQGRRFFIDYWNPAPDDAELELLIQSPLRQTLVQRLGERVALLLYAPGTDGSNTGAKAAIDAAAERWSQKNHLGVEVIELDRNDPQERLLSRFIGLPVEGPDWAAVMFGRGKLMPPLKGEDISEGHLDECLGILLEDCTCIQSPSLLGVDIPLLWDASLDVLVRAAVLPEPNTAAVGSSLVSGSLWTVGVMMLLVAAAVAAIVWKSRIS